MNAPLNLSASRKLELRGLLDALVHDGWLDAADARQLQQNQGARLENRHPLNVIADAAPTRRDHPGETIMIDSLLSWLSERTQLPVKRIDPLSIDVVKVTALIPYAYAARLRILPILVNADSVTIATAEPLLHDWDKELTRILGRRIDRVLANPADLDRYLLEFYALARSVKASEDERRNQPATATLQSFEQLTDLSRAGNIDANDQHVVSIVDWLLGYAYESRASDIHLEPRREHGNVRFRIDGIMHEVYRMPPGVMAAVCSRIKILARMDVAEKRRPQDGRIKTRRPDGREVELRVASMPTAFGEKLVLRIFDPEVLVKDFAALGLPAQEQQWWEQLVREPHGILLVTGPTGSGKTTTLYSTLKRLATPKVNICTIEDPIEMIDPAMNQMQVQPQIDLSFAAGIRALMRQDPDVIMVGEIRDLETAETAVQAALTGHLVLSTLHTNDAPSAVTRLMDLGVPGYLLRATLLGVVAQRLVRRLCPHCREPVEPSESRWNDLRGPWALERPEQIYEAGGCLECRETGFLGRSGLYEMMRMTPSLRERVSDSMDLALFRDHALREGMTPLRIAGGHRVAEGQTTIEEILRATPAVESRG